MIKNIIKLTLLTTTLSLAVEQSALYSNRYMPQSGVEKQKIETNIPNIINENTLKKKTEVAKVLVYIEDGEITPSSKEKLQELLTRKRVNSYVSIVGYTSSLIDQAHQIELSIWAELWHNIANSNRQTQSDIDEVNNRIAVVYNYLKDNGVSTDKIYNINQMDRNQISTEITSEGKALNRRVVVSVYN